jgi:2,3-bisphosphoglycerate-independent phosphoglycerate mutase
VPTHFAALTYYCFLQPCGTIEDNDAVVLFNFRSDRMVELSKAFEYTEEGKFTGFDRERVPKTKFVGMMQYDGDLHLPANYLIPPPTIAKTSGEWLAKNGLRTFACSETQKFGHVTFFWNGNRSVRAWPACSCMALRETACTRGGYRAAF